MIEGTTAPPRGERRCRRNFRSCGIVVWLKEATMHKEGEHTVESAVEARGGFLGRPVLVVLVVSVAMACVAMGLSYAGFFATS
jgi:hypothetical protein